MANSLQQVKTKLSHSAQLGNFPRRRDTINILIIKIIWWFGRHFSVLLYVRDAHKIFLLYYLCVRAFISCTWSSEVDVRDAFKLFSMNILRNGSHTTWFSLLRGVRFPCIKRNVQRAYLHVRCLSFFTSRICISTLRKNWRGIAPL